MLSGSSDLPGSAQPVQTLPFDHLTFRLGDDEYAIDIRKVRELCRHDPDTVTSAPGSTDPQTVKWRRHKIPLIDLRARGAYSCVNNPRFSVLVVLDVGDATLGMLVDSVIDVLALHPDRTFPAPTLACGGLYSSCFKGFANIGGRTIFVIDIEKLIQRHASSLRFTATHAR